MFSLGHSTIVVIGSIAIAATTLALQHGMSAVTDIGGVIGTLLSTLFLFALGFDTATEIGLLGISAAEAFRGLSMWSHR